MSNILIAANNICKVYDQDILLKRGANFYALQNIDFNLYEGDFISVMGPSGSGKSTLLNCLSTLDNVTSGVLKVLGKEVSQMSDNELSLYRNKYLGFIFQNHNLVSSLSIFDNIATPLILNEEAPDQIIDKVNEIAKKLNIQKLLYKKPNECSGGERQRAAIARAIVSKPKILVCDEPTGNLDTVNSHELLGMLTKLNQEGTSIILVTHDSMIASYAKKFIYLRDGKIINEINRNNASQVDFFNEIVKITTQDSLLKLFNDTADSKNVFSNNIDSSVTNSEVVIENEVANKVSETSNNEGMEVNVINKETKPVRRIVYAIFAGLEYDESSSKRYRILHFEEDTIDFQFSNIEKLHVTYPEVEKAIISMCSRYVPSFPMPENRFYLDLDLVLKDGKTYKFEVNNQRNATSLFDVLHQHNIKVEDPCGFEELYRSKGDYLVRHRWLLYNFRKIVKQYHLDNPRGESKSFY